MSRQELYQKINTLENFYVCPGVELEIEELRKQNMSYDETWKHFKLMDDIEH